MDTNMLTNNNSEKKIKKWNKLISFEQEKYKTHIFKEDPWS